MLPLKVILVIIAIISAFLSCYYIIVSDKNINDIESYLPLFIFLVSLGGLELIKRFSKKIN